MCMFLLRLYVYVSDICLQRRTYTKKLYKEPGEQTHFLVCVCVFLFVCLNVFACMCVFVCVCRCLFV